MTAWQQLALLEWRRSILQGRQNLDFFWLTILLTLTLLLTLLLWGGREGLLNKFVDVSIGYVENAGIPIWLATNRIEGIDRALLQELAAQNMTIHPYREVEWHQVDFPDHDSQIWRDKVTPFLGWAVSSTDPLWQAALTEQETADIPLTIVLNQSLFSQYFDCKAYISALQRRSPLILSTIQDPADCLANDILWLDVKLGNTRELLPFHIRWQRHLPSIQPLAFLFPLSTLNTLIIANTEQALQYYPRIRDSGRRVKQLMLRTTDVEIVPETLAALSPCLPNATIERRRITLAVPLPDTWLAHCFAQYSNIPLHTQDNSGDPPYFKVTEFVSMPYAFAYDRKQDWLIVTCAHCGGPCSAIPSLKEKVIAHGCETEKATIDVFKAVGSYQRAFVYVENRLQLAEQLEKLKNFPVQETTKVFYFHRTYDDALVRFKFIDKIMQLLELFFSPFFFIFVVILLIVQVGIVIAHRKHNYGILLAKGIAWKQIQWMIFLQLTLSFLFAVGGAILISESMQSLLAGQLAHVTASPPYVDHIVTSGLDLLPLAINDYLKVGGMILTLLYMTGFFLLKAIIAQHHREPAYLFSAS